MKGDCVGLKQAVLSCFDPTSLGTSHKLLWDVCGEDLARLSMPYHARRGSDKRQVTDVLLADIVAAFDKLDSAERIPAIYCKATDLIQLPILTLDPVSKKLDENNTALQSLAHRVDDLPLKVLTDVANTVSISYSQLEKLISGIKVQLQQFSGCVDVLSHKFPDSSSTVVEHRRSVGGQSHSAASGGTLPKQHSSTPNRSNNVILFGLPESSLLEAKTAIDNVFTYLIGENVKIVDAFRLGRRPETPSARPRPLLIKLDNYWDRSKLFLREDLPPEERTLKSKGQAKIVAADVTGSASSSLPNQPSSAVGIQPAIEHVADDKSVPPT